MPQVIEKSQFTGIHELKGSQIMGCQNQKNTFMDGNGVVSHFPWATNHDQS